MVTNTLHVHPTEFHPYLRSDIEEHFGHFASILACLRWETRARNLRHPNPHNVLRSDRSLAMGPNALSACAFELCPKSPKRVSPKTSRHSYHSEMSPSRSYPYRFVYFHCSSSITFPYSSFITSRASEAYIISTWFSIPDASGPLGRF